jgi:16S rRNA processing protein RimM
MSSTPIVDFGGTDSVELTVGRIGRPHGLRGEVTVDIRTDDPKERFAPGASLQTDARGPLTVASYRVISGLNVIRFEGFDDRNAAETLRGTLLVVEAEALPELEDENEYYDHQLIGLAVQLVGSPESIGEVTDLMHLPSNDVLVVKTALAATGEVLIPFVAAVVPTVDVTAGFLTVDPPDGLFE